MLVKKRQSVKLCDQLLCLPLAPDQIMALEARVGKGRYNDREVRYFDGPLVDCFMEVFRRNQWQFEEEQLRASLKDPKLTKRFYHVRPTLENLDHFVDQALERRSFRWSENFRAASVLVKQAMSSKELLQPVTVESEEEIDKVWSNKKASAGAIGRGSKEDNRAECYVAFRRIRDLIKSGTPYQDIQIPNLVFHRAQISGYMDEKRRYKPGAQMKDRLIWGSDGATVSLEGLYARPLMNHVMRNWFSYSGGDEPEVLRRKIRSAQDMGWQWTSIDYSKFDQTIQSWVIEECFDIIKSFFDKRYHKELGYIAYNFIHTWILLPGLKLVQKHRGIPSGSYFTQLVGSMSNALMVMTYIASKCKGSLEEKVSYVQHELGYGDRLNMFVMGDDNLLFTRHELDLDDMAAYVNKIFGTKINADKTVTSMEQRNPHYLKRDWTYAGEFRDILDLAINVCHPEWERTYDGYSPWHIMYGLYLTYRASFGVVSELDMLEKISTNGGFEPLLSVDLHALPGAFRIYGDDARRNLYNRAKATLRYQAA